MSKKSQINWCDSSAGFWEGCTFQSDECANCWAFMNDLRFYSGVHWGSKALRRKVRGAASQIRGMQRASQVCGKCGEAYDGEHSSRIVCGTAGCGGDTHRRRVFLNHSCEWLDLTVDPSWRLEMFDSVVKAPGCDFILCTKQPGNFMEAMWKTIDTAEKTSPSFEMLKRWVNGHPPDNVVILFSAGRQCYYDERLPLALKIPAKYHGVSAEPLLEPINFRLNKHAALDRDRTVAEELDWIIIGGESGRGKQCQNCKGSGRALRSLGYPALRSVMDDCPKCQGSGLVHAPRPCFLEWLYSARIQVGETSPSVPLFIKQVGSLALFENANFWDFHDGGMITSHPITTKLGLAAGGRMMTAHQKGGDPEEWPAALRLQRFYTDRR
jgi:protein gp37